MAANMPFKYMGAVMFGNGLAAIFCNVLRAITLIAFPYDPEVPSTYHNSYVGAVVFCSINAGMMLSCVFVQLFVLKDNAFYIYYLDWIAAERARDNHLGSDQEAHDLKRYTKLNLTVGAENSSESVLSKNDNIDNNEVPIGFEYESTISIAKAPIKETWGNFFRVAKENFQTTNSLLYLLLIVFILTFTVFPGVTFDTNLDMLKNVKNSDGWFVLMMNSIFSVFDTVGRKLGGLKQFDLSVGGIKVVSATRLIFLATFWLIAFQIGPSWLFVADWFIICNMVVFSFSNGYVSTLCAVKAPGQVP